MSKRQKDVLYMAPLQGITNYIYRSAYSKYFSGYSRAITPFIATCDKIRMSHKYFKDIMPKKNRLNFQLIPQILSKDPNDFVAMVKAISDFGYDYVNLNLGCPIPMVRKKKRGSGMLPHPDLIKSFLDNVMPRIKSKLSIKVRLGCEDKSELSELIPVFNDYSLEEIIIHPRTGIQMYRGEVDLDTFEDCLSLSEHPVIFSGDINSKEIFGLLKKRFNNVSGWMIGRGGIVDPFLPEKIKSNESLTDVKMISRFKNFHDAIFDGYSEVLYGPKHVLDKMKELWSYWGKAFVVGDEMYQKICRFKKTEPYCRDVSMFFNSNPKLKI